jgi:hypothetical protein
MHPTIGYRLSQDHLADLHKQARRRALARADRRGRRARPHHCSHPRPALRALARQARAVLGTRGW